MSYKEDEIFKEVCKNNDLTIVKNLGKGGFGLVKEVIHNDKHYAAKLVERDKTAGNDESKNIKEFKGPGIVKVIKTFSINKNNITYDLIVMEKAPLKNISYFNKHLFNNNFLQLIFKSPFEVIGDNLIRFYVKQIVKGLELLDRSNFSHFDIKPENILTFSGLKLKLTDFGLLRNTEKKKDTENKVMIPGGTLGYISPECYLNNFILDIEDAKKQDIFALGATIFYLKYEENLLDYNAYKINSMTSDLIVDLLQKKVDKIKSEQLLDKDFIDFLCSLIQYKPSERPNLEEIYRNKWLNKNSEELIDITENNELDKEKLIIELNKSDFLIPKKNYLHDRNRNSPRQIHKFIFRE